MAKLTLAQACCNNEVAYLAWQTDGKIAGCLGFMITRYANVFEMDKVFVPVIVLMVLGVSLTTMLKWFGRRIAPWSHGNR